MSACETSDDLVEAARQARSWNTTGRLYRHGISWSNQSKDHGERGALRCLSLRNHGQAQDHQMERPSTRIHQRSESEPRPTASLININSASRVTCVKPEGTASLVLGASSGIHPAHSKRYLRRIQCSDLEPVFQHFRAGEPSSGRAKRMGSDHCVIFPIEAPENAITKEDLTALELLDHARRVKRYYVDSGTAIDRLEGATHNVSLTGLWTWDEWRAWRRTCGRTGKISQVSLSSRHLVTMTINRRPYKRSHLTWKVNNRDMRGDYGRC